MLSRSYQTVTPTAGSATALISAHQKCLLRLAIKPTTPTNQFDVEITDQYGIVVYSIETQVGELIESLEIPSFTNLTLSLSNVDTDEDFEVLLVFREER